MSNEMMFCRDCAYLQTSGPKWACFHPHLEIWDLVAGTKLGADPWLQRNSGVCGPSGVLWEPAGAVEGAV